MSRSPLLPLAEMVRVTAFCAAAAAPSLDAPPGMPPARRPYPNLSEATAAADLHNALTLDENCQLAFTPHVVPA